MFLEFSVPIGLFFGLIKLVSLGYQISDTLGSASIYSGAFGVFLVIIKVFQWGFFQYSLWETSNSSFLYSGSGVSIRGKGDKDWKIKKFVRVLGWFGTFFILGFVVLLGIGGLLPHAWQHIFLEITRLVLEGATLIAMASLLTKKTGIYRDVSLMF